MKHFLATLVLTCFVAACGREAPDPQRIVTTDGPVRLEQVWELEGFKDPESVTLSQNGDLLYVSNVNGAPLEKDGDGYISRVSLEGEMLDEVWVDGLDAPKGLVVGADGKLWVNDIDKVRSFHVDTGRPVDEIAIVDAVFLNDVATLPNGGLVLSDEVQNRLISLKDGVQEVLVDSDQITKPNGLLSGKDALYVATMSGGVLLGVAYDDHVMTRLAAGFGEGDGLAQLSDSEFIISHWPGRIAHVDIQSGETTVLMDSEATGLTQNDLILVDDMLIVASWSGQRLTAWKVIRN